MTKVKLRRKGIIILPKALRESAGLEEGDILEVKVEGDRIILRPLRPSLVDVDPTLVDEVLREEAELEERKARRIIEDLGNRVRA